MSVGTDEAVAETVEETAVDSADEITEVAETQEATEVVDSSETVETAETPAPPDWITDDVRDLAGSYGIEDADLTGFESGADFHRACRLLDRTMTRRAEAPAKEEAKPAEKEQAAASATDEEDLTIDLAKYEGYDEETLRVVKVAHRLQEENKAVRAELASMSQQMRSEFDRLGQERQEALHDMEISRFHDVMDGMDKNMFGGAKDLTEETDGRRKAVWEAYRMISQALPQPKSGDGRPVKPPPLDILVKRAAMLAFGDEMIEAERKRIYGEIHDQSRGRRPSPSKGKAVSPAKDKGPPKTLHEAAMEIANSPEIASLFDKAQEESGNAPQ